MNACFCAVSDYRDLTKPAPNQYVGMDNTIVQLFSGTCFALMS